MVREGFLEEETCTESVTPVGDVAAEEVCVLQRLVVEMEGPGLRDQ